MAKYIEWEYVKVLLGLIETRNSFYYWSDSYEKYDRKVKKTIEWLERNAREIGNELKGDVDENKK